MKIVSKTDIGLKRETNQDSFAAAEINNSSAFAVVCDGMGGANGGNVASTAAVKNISESIISSFRENMSSNSVRGLLEASIFNANLNVYEKAAANPELKGMGTTVVTAVITGGVLYIAHAGDSRAYMFRDGVLTQLTRDHSIVQSMIDEGKITSEEAKLHPKRNVITRAIGVGKEISIDFNEYKLIKGDRVLICSDGLTGYSSEECILEKLKGEIDKVTDSLIDSALSGGGGDNVTVVVIEY